MIPNKCKNCEAESLFWFADVYNSGHAVDGRLRSSEVVPIFVLGCEECSETIMVVDASEIAIILNDNKEFMLNKTINSRM
jgi:hypothetical protein